jgi:hypothetical protein
MTLTEFLFGYVGNLLATITGVAVSLAIYKIFVPWYQEITYQGVDISGTWTMITTPPHRRHITWELKQHAARISGISTHIAKEPTSAADRVRTYRLEGKIVNRFLTITGYPTDPRRMGCICYVVEILGDATKMAGYGAAYSSVKCKMIGGECVLTRNTEPTPTQPNAQTEQNG